MHPAAALTRVAEAFDYVIVGAGSGRLRARQPPDGGSAVRAASDRPRDSDWIHIPLGTASCSRAATSTGPTTQASRSATAASSARAAGAGRLLQRQRPGLHPRPAEDFDAWEVPGCTQAHALLKKTQVGISDIERHELCDTSSLRRGARHPRSDDFNGERREGTGYYQAWWRGSRRSSTAVSICVSGIAPELEGRDGYLPGGSCFPTESFRSQYTKAKPAQAKATRESSSAAARSARRSCCSSRAWGRARCSPAASRSCDAPEVGGLQDPSTAAPSGAPASRSRSTTTSWAYGKRGRPRLRCSARAAPRSRAGTRPLRAHAAGARRRTQSTSSISPPPNAAACCIPGRASRSRCRSCRSSRAAQCASSPRTRAPRPRSATTTSPPKTTGA